MLPDGLALTSVDEGSEGLVAVAVESSGLAGALDSPKRGDDAAKRPDASEVEGDGAG